MTRYQKVQAEERRARIFLACFGAVAVIAMIYMFGHASSIPVIAG